MRTINEMSQQQEQEAQLSPTDQYKLSQAVAVTTQTIGMTNSYNWRLSIYNMFTDHFSGSGRAIGPVCVCLCVPGQ